ncbi:hypothetical protein FRB91_005660 [Serendipita sp. 411]|nr:hypothetical protein FRB91_005660 [Serendipita sp. 411]
MDGLTFTQTVPGILSRIVDRFILPGWFNGPTTGLHLPPNIKKLRIYSGTLPDTNFPHVESLIFQSAVSFFVDKLPDCFPNLKTLILSATNLPDPDFFLLVELPHLEHLTTHKFGYAHLNRLSAPRLQTLTLYLSGSGAAMPSWMKEKTIQISDLGNPADYIGMNISPQRELAFLLPVSLPTLNSFLRCTSKFKHLGVLFVGDDARTLLTTMFRSTEGYLQERKGGEPEFWEASVHLERLGLVLDCKMDEEQVVAWEECASRFYASRSAETRLRQLDVIWSCREKRRAKV